VHPRVVDAQRALFEQWREELSAGARRVGWKVGHDIAEAQGVLGLQPVVGYLTTATLLQDGATYSVAQSRALRAETELVVELADDVCADAPRREIEAAIAGIGVALELVDVARPASDLEGIVRGNVFHRAFALGPSFALAAARAGRATLAINARRHDADEPIGDVTTIDPQRRPHPRGLWTTAAARRSHPRRLAGPRARSSRRPHHGADRWARRGHASPGAVTRAPSLASSPSTAHGHGRS
jgi:hypothetical protein